MIFDWQLPVGGEAGVVGEHPGLGVELGDVDDIGPHRAAEDREIVGLVTYRERCSFVAGFCVHREVPDEIVAKTAPTLVPFSRQKQGRPDCLEGGVKWRSLLPCALQDGRSRIW